MERVVDADPFCRLHGRSIVGIVQEVKLSSGHIEAILQPGNLQGESEPAGPREIRFPVVERIGRSDQHSLALPWAPATTLSISCRP